MVWLILALSACLIGFTFSFDSFTFNRLWAVLVVNTPVPQLEQFVEQQQDHGSCQCHQKNRHPQIQGPAGPPCRFRAATPGGEWRLQLQVFLQLLPRADDSPDGLNKLQKDQVLVLEVHCLRRGWSMDRGPAGVQELHRCWVTPVTGSDALVMDVNHQKNSVDLQKKSSGVLDLASKFIDLISLFLSCWTVSTLKQLFGHFS